MYNASIANTPEVATDPVGDECYYSQRLINKIENLNQSGGRAVNLDQIRKAIMYAKYWHEGQFRDSGEEYYSHPLEVAYLVSDYCFKTDIIVTAILHDVLEDTHATMPEITKLFNVNIANNVMDLTRIKSNGHKITSAELVDLLLDDEKDELLLIKLLDRLHNLRTIQAKPLVKINKIVKETRATFTTLAVYLHLPKVEAELNQICTQWAPQTILFNGKIQLVGRQENLCLH